MKVKCYCDISIEITGLKYQSFVQVIPMAALCSYMYNSMLVSQDMLVVSSLIYTLYHKVKYKYYGFKY